MSELNKPLNSNPSNGELLPIESNNSGQFLPDNSDFSVKKRRKWLLQQYLECRMPSDIYEEWLVRYPGLSRKSFDVDVTHAYKELDNHIGTNEELITKHIGMYYDLYRTNKETNPSIAMKALSNIERLKKLHLPDVAVQINNNSIGTASNQLENLSLDQLKELLTVGTTPTD